MDVSISPLPLSIITPGAAWAVISARTQEEETAMVEEAMSMLYGMVSARAFIKVRMPGCCKDTVAEIKSYV